MGTIAAGSAYPVHNRTQTEDCVTKPRFYPQKGVSTMKREDVKNKIPGITEEQLNWLMQENGSDIIREKFLSTLSLRRATAKVHKTVGHFCAYETNFMGIASSC